MHPFSRPPLAASDPPGGAELRLRAILESAPLGIVEWTVDLEVRGWDGRAATILGVAREEALGRRLEELPFLEPERRSEMARSLRRLLTGGRASSVLAAPVVREGGRGHTVWHTTVLQCGGAPALLSLVEDVTRERNALEQLGEREVALLEAQALARLGYWDADVETGQVQLSAGACGILGLNPGTVGGQEDILVQQVHPEDRGALVRARDATIAGGPPMDLELRVLRTDGEQRWLHVLGRAVREGGRTSMLHGTIQDVTEGRRAREELRASEERYRLLFERNPLPMLVVDRETMAILSVNEAAVNHYGYSREEFLGMTALDIRPPEEWERFLEGWQRRTPGLRNAGIWTHRKKDGTLVQMEIVRHDFEQDGLAAVLVLAQDVTDRLSAEEEVRRSREELRRFSRYLQEMREEERSRLAREIHDELGQVLTGVRMGLARLGGRLRAGDADTAERLVDETAELVDGAIREVRRIATQLRPGILDQLGLVPALEWLVEDFQERYGIPARITSPGPLGELAPEAQTQLFRIVQEALTNVARHARARSAAVRSRIEDGTLVVDIADDGVGFDPSSPGSASLGLLGIRERARLLDGEVRIRSAPGAGTTLTVRVPLPDRVHAADEAGS